MHTDEDAKAVGKLSHPVILEGAHSDQLCGFLPLESVLPTHQQAQLHPQLRAPSLGGLTSGKSSVSSQPAFLERRLNQET